MITKVGEVVCEIDPDTGMDSEYRRVALELQRSIERETRLVERCAALEKENAELVTRCNRLTALVREAVKNWGTGGDCVGEGCGCDNCGWTQRAKAELEGK